MHYERRSSRSFKAAITALTSASLFIISVVNPHVYHTLQVLFAIVYTSGVLIVDLFGSASLIAFIGGLLHSTTCPIGLFIMPSWLIRGFTTDLLFKALRIYGSRPHPYLKTAFAMALSSVFTGLSHYLILVKALRLIPEPAFILVLAIFAVAAIFSFVGALIAVKVVNRYRGVS
ncbi:MAG: hypothetical protein DRJ31_09075 [Candidatus Methanomethylicota archaeon]|uniref:ECF transporter S component n=1 Tax=Thermoproteota archaeon TaxID=2056631 RepID=A0A497EK89_9CREN|nr:MAG: hypothetical protein DRJ31_09075 [Candidatus Verstraetearchaeota archaeon]